MKDSLLQIENLKTSFTTPWGEAKAVDGVFLGMEQGKTLGLVGESGCGKSVLALSLLRLVAEPAGRIVSGKILWKGRDLTTLSEAEMRQVRGKEIAMIFQEPLTSLNPVFTIGYQISEAVELHQGLAKEKAWEKVRQVLRKVGLSDPERQARSYPHELSGGMRQRAMIAMALSCEPELLIADEPTTALDVTIQAQILELLKSLQQELRLTLLLITHDLGIVAQCADEIAVMYCGKITEYASTQDLFKRPSHPYTRGLLQSLPAMEHLHHRLTSIPGAVPPAWQKPAGCTFHPRCSLAKERCRTEEPKMVSVQPGHQARCFFAKEIAALTKN